MSVAAIIYAVTASLATLWDLGRRFADRPSRAHSEDLKRALDELKAAQADLHALKSVVSTHTDKLSIDALKKYQPLGPVIKR
jgi:hypothetical protein